MIGRMRGLAACTLVVALLLAPGRASAESGATLVAIVTSQPGSRLTRRVATELRGIGVDVIVLSPPAEGSTLRAPLEQAARGVGAVAAVRLIPSAEGRVEVWVADRVTGKAVVRELPSSESGTSDDAVAVGAVELLRASLMELHSAEPPHGDIPATEAVRALALPSSPPRTCTPRLSLAIGAGAELGVRGLGPSADLGLAAWARITPHLGARLVGHTSLSASHVTTEAGSVDVEAQLFGVMLTYGFAGPTSDWAPSLSAGMGASHVTTHGAASPPFEAATDAGWFAAPMLAVGLAYSFARGLRLYGEALAAWAIPAAVVRTPSGTAGRWGAPAITTTLGVEVVWGS